MRGEALNESVASVQSVHPRTVCLIALPGTDEACRVRLREALSDQFASVTEGFDNAAGADIVVGLLPEGDSGREGPESAALGDLADRLVPVVIGTAPSRLLADRSQVVQPVGAESAVARRVSALARLGGRSLVEVNELTAAARRWQDNGGRASDLLGAADSREAPALVAKAAQAGIADLDLLSRFAKASTDRARRSARRRRTISLGVAAALVIVSAVSLGQKLSADQAAAEARDKAATARANRLSGELMEMLNNKPDPDVAWALAEAALTSKVNAQSARAAQQVRAAIPTHRSIALDNVPTAVSGAQTGVFAVTFVDRTAQIRDRDGAVIREAPDSPIAVLTQDGSRLALIGNRALVNSDAGRGVPVGKDQILPTPGAVLAAAWVGTELWGLTPSGVFQLGALTPEPKLSQALPHWLGTLHGLSSAQAAPVVAVVGSGGMAVLSSADGRLLYSQRATDLADAVLTADGTAVYLHTRQASTSVVNLKSDQPRPSSAVAAFRVFAAGPVMLESALPGALCAATPPEPGASGCVNAHSGTVTGAASLGSDRFVSVGTDRYARIWSGLNAARYPFTSVNGSTYAGLGGNQAQERASRRSQIEVDPTSGRVATFTYEIGTVSILSSDLSPIGSVFLGLPISTRMVLSPGGSYLATSRASGLGSPARTAVWDFRGTGQIPTLWAVEAGNGRTESQLAVSPDGQVAVSASPTTVAAWRNGELILNTRVGSRPVGIVFGATGPVVYLADGSVVSTDESAAGLSEPALAVTGGNADSGSPHTAWVSSDRRLMESVGGIARQIVPLPAGLPVYALKYSPSLRRLAIFADREAMVVDCSTGTVLYDAAADAEVATIQDVAFPSEDRIASIEHSGGLRVTDLIEPDELLSLLRAGEPRPLSDTEQAAYQLTEDGRR